MAVTMLGMFKDQKDSENAIAALKDMGYNPKDMSIIMRDVREAQATAQSTGVSIGEGVATGATTGAVVGAITGLLIGIGAVTIPGLGAVLIGGPIATALGLTGAAATTTTGAVGGALAGGLIGALVELGLPQEQAQRYEEVIRGGGILLAVPVRENRTGEVHDALAKYNAADIREIDLPSEPVRRR